MGKKIFSHLRWVLFALLAVTLLVEATLRIGFRERFSVIDDERNLAYRHDEQLGWFPKENTEQPFLGSHTISVKHNDHGFRDEPRGPKTRKRILFLGDSFVWGYDVEQEDRFTERLQRHLPDWEVLNLGVSGFGTDQEYLLLQRYFDTYQPDVVFLIFDVLTDHRDNRVNKNHADYYKPYFVIEDDLPVLKGVPVPKGYSYYKSERPFLFRSFFYRALLKAFLALENPEMQEMPFISASLIKTMKQYVETKGALFAIGFTMATEDHQEQTLCERNRIRCLDLSTDKRFPTHGYHWTAEGHAVVATRIFHFLFPDQVAGDSR